MGRTWFILGLSLLLVAAPDRAFAQAQSCDLIRSREGQRVMTPLGEIIYISGPASFRCEGGVDIEADSAIFNRGAGELRLIGNAQYRDPEKTLSADGLTYLGRDGRLLARGSVVFTDRVDGSVVTGTDLDHRRAGPNLPESITVVTGGRPRAVLRPRAAAGDDALPLQVDADRLTLTGEERFEAEGRVEIVRGETRAYARRADFDGDRDLLILEQEARVEGEEFQMFGDRIEALLDEDRLREVLAERNASVLARDLRVDAPRVWIQLVEGEFERMVARGGIGGAPQARAATRDFRLIADSIDARAPGEVLTEVVAIGAAHGERLEDDFDVPLPALVDRDWVSGDTINAYFAQRQEAADTVARSELERLVALAGADPARSMYRMADDDNPGGRPQVNYLLARSITLRLENGEVMQVEAEGPIRGVHLQPERRAAVRPEDER